MEHDESELPSDLPNSEAPDGFRNSNPKLHALYVKWACTHLTVIDRQIKELQDFANINMLDVAVALEAARMKLVRENPAYKDADEICRDIRKARRRKR
jgi:glutathionyl-hydroquinone reductase